MIRIERSTGVDINNVIRHSPVAAIPDAHAKMVGFMLSSTELWVGYYKEEVACVCGLIAPSFFSTQAYLWMLSTKIVDQHQFLFVRHSQMWVNMLLETYDTITGHTEIGNDRTMRWLRWLGAEFGPHEGKLVPFMIRKRNG